MGPTLQDRGRELPFIYSPAMYQWLGGAWLRLIAAWRRFPQWTHGEMGAQKCEWLTQLVLWESRSGWLWGKGFGHRSSICPGGVQAQDTPPYSSSSCPPCPCSTASLKCRAPSLPPSSCPPFLPILPEELIYFSKYKWTLSHKDTTYVVSYVIC